MDLSKQNINPYMTNSLYGFNSASNTSGVRANSMFTNTLTNSNAKQAIQYEEILTGSISYTELIYDAFAQVYNGSLTINFSDQNKSVAPQCLIFTAGNSNDTAFQAPGFYLEFEAILQTIPGSLEPTGFVRANARADGIVITVRTKNIANSYYFTVYVISSNQTII